MQLKKAMQLKKRWGDKPPCENPSFDTEYHYGSDTGDLVCAICGHYDWEHTSKTPTLTEQE
jgi:hypothetical protein